MKTSLATKSVPLDAVVSDIDLEWEDPILVRWDRRPAITVQCAPDGVSFPRLLTDAREDLEQIEPAGSKSSTGAGACDSKVGSRPS